MVRLHLFYQASPTFGYGHRKRCETLAAEFNSRGCDTALHNLCELDALTAEFAPADYVLADIGSENIRGIKAIATKLSTPCIGIDYFGPDLLDLVICGFAHFPPAAEQLSKVSHEFFIIRPEIKRIRSVSMDGYVLVTTGGGDVKKLASEILRRVSPLTERVLLIRGPYSEKENFEYPNVEVLENPPDLPQLMARSDWIVSNGGGAMLESIFLRKPVFAVPQSENEERLSLHFLKEGMLLGVGIDSIYKPYNKTMESSSNVAWIDGLGVERICDEVLNFR